MPSISSLFPPAVGMMLVRHVIITCTRYRKTTCAFSAISEFCKPSVRLLLRWSMIATLSCRHALPQIMRIRDALILDFPFNVKSVCSVKIGENSVVKSHLSKYPSKFNITCAIPRWKSGTWLVAWAFRRFPSEMHSDFSFRLPHSINKQLLRQRSSLCK